MGATVARAAAGVERELRTWHRATIGRNVAGREDPAMPKLDPRIDAFPPSHRREYVEWIVEAKREETRAARLKQTIAWLVAGKSRNWKDQKK